MTYLSHWVDGARITRCRTTPSSGYRTRPAHHAVVVCEVSPLITAASIGTGTVELRGRGEQQLELERLARELQRAPVADVARAKRTGRRDLEVEIARAVGLGVFA